MTPHLQNCPGKAERCNGVNKLDHTWLIMDYQKLAYNDHLLHQFLNIRADCGADETRGPTAGVAGDDADLDRSMATGLDEGEDVFVSGAMRIADASSKQSCLAKALRLLEHGLSLHR